MGGVSASPGIPFGSYVLIKRLARGGMAEVFLGRQKGLQGFDRLVAVKRVLPHLADSQEFIRMFFDEARLAAKLSHPHIVHIYEFGKVGEDYFIAMEYVHGVHAGQLIAHAAEIQIPPVLVARLGADACGGLHYAHQLRDEAGKPYDLVHRDMSPPNLLISYDGTVKVVDFGIAKAAISVEQTRPGVVKGKYAYMSPEQTIGKRLTHKSDVFSLAMVMWELLAGQLAVTRDDKVAAMKMIRDGQVPRLEEFRPDAPPALSLALTMAMQVDPEQRFSALDFKVALEEYIKTAPSLGSAIEVSQWIRERFPWQSPTGDSAVDSLLTRATQASISGSPPASTGEPAEDEKPTVLFDGGRRVKFIESAATIPTPPPAIAELEEATEIADGPPVPYLPTDAPMTFPAPPPRREIYSPVTAMAASIPAHQPPPAPHARVKRIGIAAGAALLLGVGVLLAVSGGDEPSEDRTNPGEAVSQPGQPDGGDAPSAIPDSDGGDTETVSSVQADAAPALATVEIVSRPSNARITISGRDALTSPAQFANLSPGTYPVRVELDGYVPIEREIAVEAGQYRTVELSLVPLPPAPIDAGPTDEIKIRRKDNRPGRLIVRTSPYSVAYLGGRKLDTTPFARDMKPGTYTLTFKSPGYPPQKKTVRIRPGQKRKLQFNLKK